MKMRLVTAAVTASLLAGAPASAQVGGVASTPIGITSPLSIGPLSIGSPPSVGPVGIPLGVTELAAPGISPMPAPATGIMGCPADDPTAQGATAQFDGGGIGVGCASSVTVGGGSDPTMPTPPTLSAGRAGIPLGSTEIASPGLSPLPPPTGLVLPTLSSSSIIGISPTMTDMGAPPAAAEPPCPVIGTFSSQATVRGARQSSASTTTASPGC